MPELSIETVIKSGVEKALNKPIVDGRSITEWAAIGMKAPRWVSVKDRLPEETNCYLVHLINNYGIEVDVYKLSDGRFHRCPGLVDYWMEIPPLPEQPKEVTEHGQDDF